MIFDPEEHELTALMKRLPHRHGCDVVEIGCGDGRLTRRYAAHVGRILAIDPDETLTASFRAGGIDANVDLRTMPVDRVELANGLADVVLFSWAL
jgi:16S rRNA A1518/A1519 N6-dimethyltransferase RsmA/KsgA/DIM1 with predicted DNA glycosylase/AP lyase activity